MLRGLVAFWKKVKSESRTIALLWLMGLAVTVLQLVLPEQVGRLTNLFEAPSRGVSWSAINRVVAWLIGSQVLIALFNYSRGRLLDRHRDRLIREASMQIYGRVIRSGITAWSNSAPESNPSLSVASRRVVPSLSAVLAIFAALS